MDALRILIPKNTAVGMFGPTRTIANDHFIVTMIHPSVTRRAVERRVRWHSVGVLLASATFVRENSK